jgi:integrase
VQRCCAIGRCCHQVLSPTVIKGARDTLRAVLNHAIREDELISRNVAASVRMTTPRSRKVRAWSVAEACRFLQAARICHDPLYAAYVLMLVLGLRRGEALGLLWADVNMNSGEIDVTWQLQRAGGQLHHRQVKTPQSEAPLPMPAVCMTALMNQAQSQLIWKEEAHVLWHYTGLVITTTHGTPYEPRNFNRHFAVACRNADVRYINPHGMRHTCGSLLAALDVHPRVAMRILRHSKIAITMEIYTEVPDDRTREALRRLGEQLDS